SEKQGKSYHSVPIYFKNKATINNIKIYPIYDGVFLIGSIIIIEDITEQEKLREQFILSEKLASVGLLAAGVAHEINNPLEIIYNYLRYLKFNLDNKILKETVDNLNEEITYISNIVSNLITFSDSNTICDEEIDLNELFKRMINLVKYNARNKNIKVNFKTSQNVIKMKADKNEIKQVILNLMKNSFEAMPGGGNIYITTTQNKSNNSEFIVITFRDTGSGIKGNNPGDIFLPFYTTKKASRENLGLGLSVSYGIIKKYNGNISVKNLEGSGCQFKITIPLKSHCG
ncbi:MAG: ATP-binding protein, partial [Spirochaetota bacterium]